MCMCVVVVVVIVIRWIDEGEYEYIEDYMNIDNGID